MNIGRRTFIRATGSASTVGLASLAGCSGTGGGDDGDGTVDAEGDGTTTTSETTTPSGENRSQIAATVPRSGSLWPLGDDLDLGYILGINKINGVGGINDRQVELLVRDDENSPEILRQQLQQLISEHNVQMIWGSYTSELASAGSAVAEEHELPFLSIGFPFEGPHHNTNYDWTFVPFPKSTDIAISCTEMLNNLPNPPQNIGLWEPDSSWGSEQANAWEQHFTDAGYDIVLREQYSGGTSDFSSLISQSQDAEVEALFSNPTTSDGITAIQQMKDSGWVPTIIHFVRGAFQQRWWSELEQDGAYVQMTSGWLPGLEGGGNEEFIEQYKLLPDGAWYPNIPYPMVGTAFGLTQTVHQAMKSAGSADQEGVRDALSTEQFDTVLGQIAFQDNGMPVTGQLTTPIGQWWEERQRLVKPQTDSDHAMETKYPVPPWDDR